jgi:hypothetical protein
MKQRSSGEGMDGEKQRKEMKSFGVKKKGHMSP